MGCNLSIATVFNMSNTIFYFTGTGNSLKVAKDIAAEIDGTNIISMAANIGKVADFSPQGAVGFIFPVYYCGLPQLVQEFISCIDLSSASYIYIACTYGAMAGNAGCISQAQRLIKSKGKVLDAAFYVKCIDNFILWTWDITPAKKHDVIHKGANQKSKDIARIVIERRAHQDKSITEHIGPVVFGYNRFLKTVKANDKAFYWENTCNACGLCEKVCPTNNIDLVARPIWKSENCQRCLACLHLCPRACIQYGLVTTKRKRYKNPHITIDELIL